VSKSGIESNNWPENEYKAMPDVDTDTRIRDLCQQILREQDPLKVQELLTLLRSIVSTAQEETRTRMQFIAQYYRNQIRAAARQRRERTGGPVSRIPALLKFLGLRPELLGGK
jgi:hypothetical protein